MLLTMALGSSWAMYAIAFPIVLGFVFKLGLNPALFVGAISGAGIAGEKLCIFTSDSLSVGSSIGCDPDAVLAARMPYALLFSLISLVLYLLAGLYFAT